MLSGSRIVAPYIFEAPPRRSRRENRRASRPTTGRSGEARTRAPPVLQRHLSDPVPGNGRAETRHQPADSQPGPSPPTRGPTGGNHRRARPDQHRARPPPTTGTARRSSTGRSNRESATAARVSFPPGLRTEPTTGRNLRQPEDRTRRLGGPGNVSRATSGYDGSPKSHRVQRQRRRTRRGPHAVPRHLTSRRGAENGRGADGQPSSPGRHATTGPRRGQLLSPRPTHNRTPLQLPPGLQDVTNSASSFAGARTRARSGFRPSRTTADRPDRRASPERQGHASNDYRDPTGARSHRHPPDRRNGRQDDQRGDGLQDGTAVDQTGRPDQHQRQSHPPIGFQQKHQDADQVDSTELQPGPSEAPVRRRFNRNAQRTRAEQPKPTRSSTPAARGARSRHYTSADEQGSAGVPRLRPGQSAGPSSRTRNTRSNRHRQSGKGIGFLINSAVRRPPTSSSSPSSVTTRRRPARRPQTGGDRQNPSAGPKPGRPGSRRAARPTAGGPDDRPRPAGRGRPPANFRAEHDPHGRLGAGPQLTGLLLLHRRLLRRGLRTGKRRVPERRFIIAHAGQAITLNLPTSGIPANATVRAYPSDDHTKCATTEFDNGRLRGSAVLPEENPTNGANLPRRTRKGDRASGSSSSTQAYAAVALRRSRPPPNPLDPRTSNFQPRSQGDRSRTASGPFRRRAERHRSGTWPAVP